MTAEEIVRKLTKAPSWATDPYNNDAACKCSECGEWYEFVRPGKHQPTCDCHMFCPLHPGTMTEHRWPAAGHKGGGIFGDVCPKCHDPCQCESCLEVRRLLENTHD